MSASLAVDRPAGTPRRRPQGPALEVVARLLRDLSAGDLVRLAALAAERRTAREPDGDPTGEARR